MILFLFIIACSAMVLWALELSDSKIYKALTRAVSFLGSLATIVSLLLTIQGMTWKDLFTSPPTNETTLPPVTYYRYRELEYTDSTEPNLEGWELYSTVEGADVFTEWSPWQTDFVESTETQEVQSKTCYRSRQISETVTYGEWSEWSVEPITSEGNDIEIEVNEIYWYGYYYFECPNCHAHMHGWDIYCPTWAGGCGQTYIPENSWHEIHSTTSWDNAGLTDFHGTGKYSAYVDGVLCYKWDRTGFDYFYRSRDCFVEQQFSEWSEYTDQPIEPSETVEVEQVTMYSFREHTKATVYLYQRWSEWSDWSEIKRAPSDNVQVESITH